MSFKDDDIDRIAFLHTYMYITWCTTIHGKTKALSRREKKMQNWYSTYSMIISITILYPYFKIIYLHCALQSCMIVITLLHI